MANKLCRAISRVLKCRLDRKERCLSNLAREVDLARPRMHSRRWENRQRWVPSRWTRSAVIRTLYSFLVVPNTETDRARPLRCAPGSEPNDHAIGSLKGF